MLMKNNIYTDDMVGLINAFKADSASNKYNESNYYLFLLNNGTESAKLGIMPYNQPFGFIFTDNESDTLLERTIAHELGHGAFGLLHTFNTYGHQLQLAQGLTDNLMDYAHGTRLYKYQWDLMQHPVCYTEVCGADASSISLPCLGIFDNCDDVLKKLKAIKDAYNKGDLVYGYIPKKLVLTGNLLSVDGINYQKIELVYTGSPLIQFNLDPVNYLEFEDISNVDNKKFKGFHFKSDDDIVLTVRMTDDNDLDTKYEELKNYLFGNGISFEVKSNDAKITEGTYVNISAVPDMPKIEVKNTSSSDMAFRLRIEYGRDIRTDDDYFPEKDWKTIKAGDTWDVDFGDKIRGGRATLQYKVGDKEYSFIFYIRGTNPTEQDVKTYLTQQGYDIWFLTRLIRQESSYFQFNEGTNYGPDWTDVQGCPNWGSPHG